MTTYENPYGLGFEKATEPGPDVDLLKHDGEWTKRRDNVTPLSDNFTYRRPIKLQVGHRYVRRDGMVVKVLKYKPYTHYCMRYLISDGMSRDENGRFTGTFENSIDLVTHIEEPETKDEPMKDTVIVNNVAMTYAQIEAAHAEMMKQKAENEIKVGDIVKHKSSELMFIASQQNGTAGEFSAPHIQFFHKNLLEKVTVTPEFMAQLRAVLEGE